MSVTGTAVEMKAMRWTFMGCWALACRMVAATNKPAMNSRRLISAARMAASLRGAFMAPPARLEATGQLITDWGWADCLRVGPALAGDFRNWHVRDVQRRGT